MMTTIYKSSRVGQHNQLRTGIFCESKVLQHAHHCCW